MNIQAEIDTLEALCQSRDVADAAIEFSYRPHVGPSLYISTYPHKSGNDTSTWIYRNSTELDMFTRAAAWIEKIPTGQQRLEKTAMDACAAAAEACREAGYADTAASLREQVKIMSDNLLTYQPLNDSIPE